MNILSFHLRGKMAHFRRYYSNSSALSFAVPPRTTILGIIAGILGYEKDTYYNDFHPDSCKVAVGIQAPQKKQIQTLNLLMIKGNNDLNGSKPYASQTPTELITPSNIREQALDYQVWFYHEDQKVMEELAQLLDAAPGFSTKGISVALGTAQHLAWIEDVEWLSGESIHQEEVSAASIVPAHRISSLTFSEEDDLHLVKEDLPLAFNEDRQLISKTACVVNTGTAELKAELSEAVRLSSGDVVTWMEES